MSKREFTVADEQHYNREGPVRWILSHLARYPVLPVINLVAAIFNNYFYSNIQVLIGRGFDLVNSAGLTPAALQGLAGTLLLMAAGQGMTGLARNYSAEFAGPGHRARQPRRAVPQPAGQEPDLPRPAAHRRHHGARHQRRAHAQPDVQPRAESDPRLAAWRSSCRSS